MAEPEWRGEYQGWTECPGNCGEKFECLRIVIIKDKDPEGKLRPSQNKFGQYISTGLGGALNFWTLAQA